MIIDYEIIDNGIYLYNEYGQCIYAGTEDQFQDWLKKEYDLSFFEFKTHSDEGDGETRVATDINWIAAKDVFYNLNIFEIYFNLI